MTNIEVRIEDCTFDAETCPVVQHIFERDSFEEAISELEPEAERRRAMLGNFITACANGTCPAQDQELTRQILRRKRNPSRPLFF